MPVYLYRCTSCDTTLEVTHKMSDPPVETCRECGGPTRRVFNAAGLIFKGSGFYTTDYARGANGKQPAEKPSAKPAKESAPACSAACGDSSCALN